MDRNKENNQTWHKGSTIMPGQFKSVTPVRYPNTLPYTAAPPPRPVAGKLAGTVLGQAETQEVDSWKMLYAQKKVGGN